LFDNLFKDTFADKYLQHQSLSNIKQEKINSPAARVNVEISLHLTMEGIQNLFHSKQEKMSFSPSWWHLGCYKVFLDELRKNHLVVEEIIVKIAFISLLQPLFWKIAMNIPNNAQKKKMTIYLTSLLQLCDADLNCALHLTWR
jgi:hypothetical protein